MRNILPIQPFTSEARSYVEIPGSKSLTNRALALAALADGKTRLQGCLFSEDTEIMGTALAQLGISIERDKDSKAITVTGNAGTWSKDEAEIHVGNAGTAARFLTAMLCLHTAGTYQMDGTQAMRNRPMQGLLDTLRQLGARITCHGQEGHFPFTLNTSGLPGGTWSVDATQSSQILSALLMSAPYARDKVELQLAGDTVSKPFVRMTLDMMRDFGACVTGDGLTTTRIDPTAQYHAKPNWNVEPDATAASYFLLLPGLVGGETTLPGLTPGMLQGDIGFEKVLGRIGMHTEFSGNQLTSRCRLAQLQGGDFDFNPISDTFLTLAASAPLLHGPTRITGIAHTRKQETDRVHAIATELRRLGQRVEETEDSLHVFPSLDALKAKAVEGVEIQTYEDHRVAMSFGILGSHNLLGDGAPWLTIANPGCCAKTFPDFFEKLEALRQASNAT
jgi:3-phosphoshikimate 1-carboxyvinyltransferase